MSLVRAKAETFVAPITTPNLAHRLWARAVAIYRLHQERQELAALDDRALRDFGATRLDAVAELRRRPWNLPPAA